MSAEIPYIEPAEITANDRVKWKKSLADYLATDGWALTYYLRGAHSTTLTITTTADGSDYLVDLAQTTTNGYTVGNYWWYAFVTKGTERYKVDEGQLKVAANPASATGTFDGRSHAKKMLDAIEAMLEGTASREEMSLSIEGRQIQFFNREELFQFRSRYRQEVKAEEKAQAVKDGKASGNRILVRFKPTS